MEGLQSNALFQMSLLLFVSLAGYLLAARLNQSAVIGLILLGIALGPSLLGWISYSPFVQNLAHLGAVILLFVIGLEFKLKEVYQWKYGIIALAGVILPWLGGFLLARLFHYPFPASVFVGTALTATSIAITANVLKEMNKLATPVARAIIGAAVIDDILGLLFLSFSQQLLQGSVSPLGILFIVSKALGFLVIGTLLGNLIFRPWLVRIDNTPMAKAYPELAFLFAMVVAFFYSLSAELVGMSAIVGALLAGVVLGGVKLKHSKDYREGAEYLRVIFASIFFVSLGILADFRAVDFRIALFVALLTALAIITKVVGCGAAARLLKLSTPDSLIIGFGMSPRGEVAMIVALIGLSQGLIGQDIYVSLVLMSLLTTLIAPVTLRGFFSRGEMGFGEKKLGKELGGFR